MAYQVEISGLQQTVRALSRMGVEAEDLRDAFGTISRTVAARAQTMVHSPSGRNRASVRPSLRKNQAQVRFNRRDKGRQIGSYVFFNANNANLGRYGFIWAAVDSVGEPWIRGEVERGLNLAIRRAGL